MITVRRATLLAPSLASRVGSASSARTITGGGLATGGGDLTADRVITVTKASGAEALAGINDTKAVTPLALATPLALKAPLADPIFTGNPRAPTPSPGDDDTSIATTAFVSAAVSAGGSGKAPINSPVFTGNPQAPTPASGDADTSIATTAFVDAAVGVEEARALAAEALKAPLASPIFTGNPQAPTPSPGDNDTSIATTGFVAAAIAGKASLADVAAEQDRAEAAELILQRDTTLALSQTTGTASALLASTAALAAPLTSLGVFQKLQLKFHLVPASNATLQIDDLPPYPLRDENGNPIVGGAGIQAGRWYIGLFDGVGINIINRYSRPEELATEAAARIAGDAATLQSAKDYADAVLDAGAPIAYADLLANGLEERPGDTMPVFTETQTGSFVDAPPLGETAVVDTDGAVLRVDDPGAFAHRQATRIEPGRRYKTRAVVRRRVNTPDPANDAVVLRIRWLDKLKNSISISSMPSLDDLTTASGRVEISAIVSTVAGTGVDLVAPAGAVYARPIVEFFGIDPVTDLEVLTPLLDITDSEFVDPDLSALQAQIDAINSENLPDRMEAVEASLTGTDIARFTSRAQAVAAAATPGGVLASVDFVEVVNVAPTGDDVHVLYERLVSAPVGSDYFADADGTFWGAVNSARGLPPIHEDRAAAIAFLDAINAVSPALVPPSIRVARYDSNSPYRNQLYVAQDTEPLLFGQDRIIDNTFVLPAKWTLGAGLSISGTDIVAAVGGAPVTATTAYLRNYHEGDLVNVRVQITSYVAGSVKWRFGAGGGDQEGPPLTANGIHDAVVRVGADTEPFLEFSAGADMHIDRWRIFRVCENHYFEAAGKYWLLKVTNGTVSPGDFGARLDGTTADDEPLKNADIFAYSNTVPLRESILFEPRRAKITKTFAPDCPAFNLKLKLGANFADEAGVNVEYALETVSVDVTLDIDGDRANQSGSPISLRCRHLLGPKTSMKARADNSKTAFQLTGATEHAHLQLHAQHCDVGLHIKSEFGDLATTSDNTPAGIFIHLITSYVAVGLKTTGDGSNATVMLECEFDIDDGAGSKTGTFLDETGNPIEAHPTPPFIQILDIGGAYTLMGKLRGIRGGIYINSKYQALYEDGSTPAQRGVAVKLNLEAIAGSQSPPLFVQHCAMLTGQYDANVELGGPIYIMEVSQLRSSVWKPGLTALAINANVGVAGLILGDLASLNGGGVTWHTDTLGLGTGWIKYTVAEPGAGNALELNKQNTGALSRTRVTLHQHVASTGGVKVRDPNFVLENILGGNIDWLGQKTLDAIYELDAGKKRWDFSCAIPDDDALEITPPWSGPVFIDIQQDAGAAADVWLRGQLNLGNTTLAPNIIAATDEFAALNNAAAYDGNDGTDGKISLVTVQSGSLFNLENRRGSTFTPRIRVS